MPEIFRTRDLIIFNKGPTYTVEVPQATAVAGWRGGQVFNWVGSTEDRLVAAPSDGLFGGIALWGSDESSDEYTSMTRQQPTYKYVTLGSGGWIVATLAYEQYTYASRTGGGALVPLTYTASDRLRVSLRGYFTIEDEWTLSGDPRAPLEIYAGSVIHSPTLARRNYLTLQVTM